MARIEIDQEDKEEKIIELSEHIKERRE